MTLLKSALLSAVGLASLTISGCVAGSGPAPPPEPPLAVTGGQIEMIEQALARVEPAAAAVCERMLPEDDCRLSVAVADESDTSINAYQVRGEPLIIFTQPMLSAFRNPDEVAFVYAHEAAHHMLRHGDKRQARETVGALLFGALAMGAGPDPDSGGQAVLEWARIGSQVGNRIHSPEEEFEADRLGADIAAMAGFDPVVGIRIFEQTADRPQLRIFPSHPRNAERIAAIEARFE